MPGPPPPPPPGGMPPPPPPMSGPPPAFKPDDRSALLKSIQKGTKLKKAVTNDKSAPILGGKISNNNTSSSPSSGGSTPSAGHPPNGLNLGGLFAGGMPKLKPTGKFGTMAPASPIAVNNNEHRRPVLPTQPMKNSSSSLQNELKKQMANDNRNRGPPPPAPIRNSPEENGPRLPPSTKTLSANGLHMMNSSSLHSNSYLHQQQNPPGLHRKVKSNVSLPSLSITDSVNGVSMTNNKPVISHGKPNLAPKPPVLNAKPQTPPKKLTLNGKPISRAHSMRTPRSPSPQSPDANNTQLKFGTVRNLSSVINQSLANSTGNLSPRNRPMLNGRPNAPPPSIPTQQPPPPPPHAIKSINFVKPPNHAPPPPPNHTPPPPNHTPPPPPHRNVPSRAPPAIPNSYAPPPPPRHSSMTSQHRKVAVDLDERFKHMFHDPSTFPKPPPYRSVFKYYGHRQGSKQQAPQPPNFQATPRTWDASSAC